MGEVAVTAAIDFGCATTWMAFASLMGWVEEVTPAKIFLTFVVIIVTHALLNTFGVKLVGPAVQRLGLVARGRAC